MGEGRGAGPAVKSGQGIRDHPAETGTKGPGLAQHGNLELQKLQGTSTQNSFRLEEGPGGQVCGLRGEAHCRGQTPSPGLRGGGRSWWGAANNFSFSSVCPVLGPYRLRPFRWPLQGVPHPLAGGRLRGFGTRPEVLFSVAEAPQAQSCSDTVDQHVGPGHCDLSCSTHREVVILPDLGL